MGLNLTPNAAEVAAAAPVVQSIAPEEKTAKQLAEEREEAKKNGALAAATAKVSKKEAPKGTLKVGVTLAQIMAATQKAKGDGVFVIGRNVPNAERIPTGVFELDLAMGGGFPRGRYSIVYGEESSCKTTITYLAIATAQRFPEPCNKAVFIDAEHAFDPVWAEKCGVDVDKLIVVKPGYGEEAGDIFEAVIKAEDVAIVVFDSLACIVSTKEAEQSLENFDVGTASILVKRMVNKGLLALAEEARAGHYPALIFINQVRYKIGVMFGNPETTPGGKAKDFASSMTLRLSAKNKIVKSVNPDVHSFKEMSVIVKKSKVPVTKANVEFDLCVYEHDGLNCGETNSWNMVSNHLKQLGALAKLPGSKGGWGLFGASYPLLETIETEYLSDVAFRLKCQKIVIDSYQGEKLLIGHAD